MLQYLSRKQNLVISMRSLRAGVNSEVLEVKVRKLGAGVRSLLAMQPRQNELVYHTTL
jgi:hypothetical protein